MLARIQSIRFRHFGMGFFWATSMLCHRSSLLFSAGEETASAATTLVFVSFIVNVFVMLTIAAWMHREPEKLRKIPAQIFMVLPIIGMLLYSAVNISPVDWTAPLIIVGAVFSGAGFGFFWGSWADVFGKIRPEKNAIIIVGNFLVAFALWLIIMAANTYLAVPALIPMLFLMPISWLCLRKCQKCPLVEAPVCDVTSYAKALGSLWYLILGASVLSFLFGYAWQLAVLWATSVSSAHILAMIGNLVVGLALLVFILVMKQRININFVYRFLVPVIFFSCLLVPWFVQSMPMVSNLIFSSGYGIFDIVIWYMIAEAAFDHRVSGFVVGVIVRSISVVARLLGMMIASLTVSEPTGATFMLFVTFFGSSYLLITWFLAYRGYRKRLTSKEQIDELRPEPDGEQENDDVSDPVMIDVVAKSQLAAARYGLSRREAEVLPYLLQGRSVRSIAELLFISESTMRSHIRHILEKMGTHSKSNLIEIVEKLK